MAAGDAIRRNAELQTIERYVASGASHWLVGMAENAHEFSFRGRVVAGMAAVRICREKNAA